MSPTCARATLPLLALLLLAPAGGAGGKKKPEKTVRVTVVVILATKRDKEVDPRLACIAREVQKKYPELTGFQMHKLSCKSVPVGVADKFEPVAGQEVTVTVQGCPDKRNRVCLTVQPPLLGEITYSTPCGKFLPLVTPYRTKADDLLILAVRVQPCPGGK